MWHTCQEVCPFNLRRALPTAESAFQPRDIARNPRLADLLLLTDEEFREKFRRSPVKRAKRRGLLRNVAVAMAESSVPEAEAVPDQAAVCDPESPMRERAVGVETKTCAD